MIHSRIIKQLRLIAEDLSPVANARIAAAIVYKGKIISIGVNQDKSHPFAAEYSKNPKAIYLHAETDCILKAKKKLSEKDLVKATIFVVRIKSSDLGDNLFGLAKPCSGCSRCIEDHQLKKVIYTEDSTLEKLIFTTIEMG